MIDMHIDMAQFIICMRSEVGLLFYYVQYCRAR